MRRTGARLMLAMLCLGFAGRALATQILVEGNRRLDADAVRAFFPGKNGQPLSTADLDDALKAMYRSSQFSTVRVSREGETVRVKVDENPLIARVVFEGNRKLRDSDLQGLIKSRRDGPLSRPEVLDDTQRLQEAYRKRGRFNARVTPTTRAEPGGRVTLLFEIEEGERTGVSEIAFKGNATFSSRTLKDVVATGETNILSGLLDNDVYDPDRSEQDQERLARYYRARGFADVSVSASAPVYDQEKRGVVLTYTLDEGPRYTVGATRIDSRIAALDASHLEIPTAVRAGRLYDATAVDDAAKSIAADLMTHGHPFARARPAIQRHPETRTLEVDYIVEETPPVYVERIEIHGNVKTLDEVIRREIRFAEGDAYSDVLARTSEARLKKLGFFKSVTITETAAAIPDRVLVNVTVEEQNSGEFFVSGGYSDAAGWLGEVTVGDTNVMGRGQSFKATVTLGQYSKGFDVGFAVPYLGSEHISASIDLFGKQTTASSFQSYNSAIYGAAFALGTPLADNLTLSWRYAIKNQDVTLAPSAVPISLPVRDAAAAGPQWVSTVGSGVTFDTLNNPRDPTSGLRADVSNDVAGLGGDVRFLQNTDNIRFYHELTDNVVGIAHGQTGFVSPWGGQALPLLDGFFGGPQLVRGFAPNGFGPRDLTPGSSRDNVGGNAYWATSYEMRTPIPWVPSSMNLKAAVFADAGSLWRTAAAKSSVALSGALIGNSPTVRSSVGAGLVWNSILGPLRVDYAYPISKAGYDVTQRVHFGYGSY